MKTDFPTAPLASSLTGAGGGTVEKSHLNASHTKFLTLPAAAVVAAAQRQRAQLKTPPIDVDHYLEILFRQGLVQATKSLATYRSIL